MECPQCRMRIPANANRCPHCQAWLGVGEDPNIKKIKRAINNNRNRGSNSSDDDSGCALAFIALVAIVLALFFVFSPGLLMVGLYACAHEIEESTFYIASILFSLLVYVVLYILWSKKTSLYVILALDLFCTLVIIFNYSKLDESKIASPFLQETIAHFKNDDSENEIENDTTSRKDYKKHKKHTSKKAKKDATSFEGKEVNDFEETDEVPIDIQPEKIEDEESPFSEYEER